MFSDVQLRQDLIVLMKRNWTQWWWVVILLDTLKDPGGATVIQFFEDVEFARGDTVKNFVFENEYFDIPTGIIGIH